MTVKKDTQRGTWYFVVDVRRAGGKRQQVKRRGFKTKKEAEAAQAAVVAENAGGAYVRPARMTVAGYLTNVWLPAIELSVRPSTFGEYRMLVNSYIVPELGNVPLADIDGPMLTAFYSKLVKSGRRLMGRTYRGEVTPGLSPKYVRNIAGVVSKAMSDAVEWRKLAVNPAASAKLPRNPKNEMKAYTPEQLRVFASATAGDRLAAIWRLCALTGMRKGELCGLRWSDVDLDAKTLQVVRARVQHREGTTIEEPKTAKGYRTIALDDATAAALRRWRKTQLEEQLLMGAGWQGGHDLLVTEPDGSPTVPNTLATRFGRLLDAAGLPRIRLHDMRHTHATVLLNAGVPITVVSERLGHASVSITLDVYTHVQPGQDEEAAARAAAIVDG